MKNRYYTVGVDFGTLSARAVLANVSNGSVVAASSFDYPHGVITGKLPSGVPLPPTAALADAADYRTALEETVRNVVDVGKAAGIRPEEIIGIGLDATSSTFLPVDAEGTPLFESEKKKLQDHPHAWMKLWKHHQAQHAADDLTDAAQKRCEPFLDRTGGKINAEWMLPKLLEIFREDPIVWRETARFMEIGDYLVKHLTGAWTAGKGPLGYKLLLSDDDPSISENFLSSAAPGFESLFRKTAPRGEWKALGEAAGFLTAQMASKLGLREGIPVAAANIDAHVAFPTLGITTANSMLMILGTSCCTILLDKEAHPVEGTFGIVKNGVLPGFYGYESGQSAVGDILSWFVSNLVPETCTREAAAAGQTVHQLLTEKAAKLLPGESGLLALDWWNGNRSVLADTALSGLILGLTLQTKPEEIYRSLIEALAFGMQEIIESHERAGIVVRDLYATGGIARKNALFMQIYADVTGKNIRIAKTSEGSALGSAIFAAACVRPEAGGYGNIFDAIHAMGHTEEHFYSPNPEHHAVYEQLYREYHRLHDTFGRGENSVMKTLLSLREKAGNRRDRSPAIPV